MSSFNFRPRLVLIPVLVIGILGPCTLSQEPPQEDLAEESRTTGSLSITGHIQTEDQLELRNGLNPEQQIRLPRSWARDPSPWNTKETPMFAGGSMRGKKECGSPMLGNIPARRLIGPILKRSHAYFATSKEELEDKMKEEDNARGRMKREVTEYHSGGRCMAKEEWIDMGADYYPRYVRSYHCTSSTCDRAFGEVGECKPKHYKTKVLKRITPVDLSSDDGCDHNLPVDLRSEWKFISVKIVTCCDCAKPTNFLRRK